MLSKLQGEMYDYIKDYIKREGRSPTYREIMDRMGFKYVRNVEHHLKKLEDEKLISREEGVHRSIKLIDPARDILVSGIPVKGIIAAGQLLDIYSDSRVDEWLDMAGELGEGNFYALIVRGDSMIGDNISDGDYVFIKEQSTCDDGDIVVAVHKEHSQVSSTLKRFASNRQLKKMYLKPSNDKYVITEIDEAITSLIIFPFVEEPVVEPPLVETKGKKELLRFQYETLYLRNLDARLFMQQRAVPVYGLLPTMKETSNELLLQAIEEMIQYYGNDEELLRDELLCFKILLQRAQPLPEVQLEPILRRIRMFDQLLEEDPWVKERVAKGRAEGAFRRGTHGAGAFRAEALSGVTRSG
jgi:repressor LexA